jgi:hypothetical protein
MQGGVVARNKASPSDLPPAIPEAIAGYQAAIDLWLFSSGQAWERFNIMLAANSILIAAIGLSADTAGALLLFRRFLPLTGLILCLLWFLLVKRSFDYAEYYTHSAREIEEKYLPSVTIVERGGAFSKGDRVTLSISGAPTSRRLSWPSRLMRGRTAGYITMGLFFLFYVAALCLLAIS